MKNKRKLIYLCLLINLISCSNNKIDYNYHFYSDYVIKKYNQKVAGEMFYQSINTKIASFNVDYQQLIESNLFKENPFSFSYVETNISRNSNDSQVYAYSDNTVEYNLNSAEAHIVNRICDFTKGENVNPNLVESNYYGTLEDGRELVIDEMGKAYQILDSTKENNQNKYFSHSKYESYWNDKRFSTEEKLVKDTSGDNIIYYIDDNIYTLIKNTLIYGENNLIVSVEYITQYEFNDNKIARFISTTKNYDTKIEKENYYFAKEYNQKKVKIISDKCSFCENNDNTIEYYLEESIEKSISLEEPKITRNDYSNYEKMQSQLC